MAEVFLLLSFVVAGFLGDRLMNRLDRFLEANVKSPEKPDERGSRNHAQSEQEDSL